jgi:ParB family chromosome partitioning protein
MEWLATLKVFWFSEIEFMKQEQIQYVPTASVEAEPQVRGSFDEESLQGLTDSIKEVGLLQPIRVRKVGNKFIILSGERRFRALVRLGEPTIAVIVEGTALNDGEVIQRMFIENAQREDLSHLDKARAIDQLMKETGWNANQVAAKLGLSNATTSRLLALTTLPVDIQHKVASGEIAMSAAYELSRVTDPVKQAERAQEAAQGCMTRDDLAKANKSGKKGPKAKHPTTPNRATAELGGRRSVTVNAPDLDVESFISTLDECLTRAKKCKQLGITLPTVIKMLKDQTNSAQTQPITQS